MLFKIGDKISFIDDVGKAIIIRINGSQLLVEREDGFEEWIESNLVIKAEILEIDSIHQKDFTVRMNHSIISKKDRGIIEKDLHIHELTEGHFRMSNYEMLQIQLNAAQTALNHARRANAKKLILIHGVGAGKLKDELYKLLDSQSKLDYYNANFLKYGAGATEIDLW